MNLFVSEQLSWFSTRWKSYPNYKDSGDKWIPEIPSTWVVLQLRQLVDPARPITYGIVQCGPDVAPNGIPYIRPVDMRDEAGVDVAGLQHTTPDIAAPYARSTIREDDLVVSIGPSFGKVMVVAPELKGANLTQGTARVTPRKISGRFLFWYLRSGYAASFWEAGCNGATFRALTLWSLGQTPVPVPPPDEQSDIIKFLDRETAKIDVLVAKKERLIELLQEKRAALISRAVTKGLDPRVPMKDSGVDWLGKIPAHWEVKRLKFLTREALQYGANEASGDTDPDQPRFVRITDITTSGELREETFRSLPVETAKNYLLEEGDLLLARSGATVGKSFMYKKSWGVCCYAGYLIRVRPDRSQILPEFLNYFAASQNYWDWISASLIQATIENVSAEKYANLLVGVAALPEQKAVVEYLDKETSRIDALIAKIRAGIEKLKEYRTALISAAVTGKIDVRTETSL